MEIQKIYGGKIEIGFEEKGHKYFINDKRVKYSSTGATRIIDKSAPLMGWAVKCMALYLKGELINEVEITEKIIENAKREYRNVSKQARDIGTAIHLWIENWIKENEQEMPDDEKVVNGITSFLKWQKLEKYKFIKKDCERLVFANLYRCIDCGYKVGKKEIHDELKCPKCGEKMLPFWYVGKLDAIATKGKKKILIDFKSSKGKDKKYLKPNEKTGIYDEYRYQLASYWNAYELEFGKTFDYGLIIRFDKNTGEFDADTCILKITREEYKDDLKAFYGALALRFREGELKKLKKENEKII